MNDLLSLSAAVRERYLEALLESLAAFMDEYQPAGPEVMFERQRTESLPYRLYRADMAAEVEGSPHVQDVTPSTHLSFEPFGLEFDDGVTAAVRPFVWNDVAIQINITLPVEPVEAWALHWLDVEGAFDRDEHGLQGVIHSISRDDGTDGSTLLSIDFGSAPVEAFRELIELGMAAGASHFSIYSETLE